MDEVFLGFFGGKELRVYKGFEESGIVLVCVGFYN